VTAPAPVSGTDDMLRRLAARPRRRGRLTCYRVGSVGRFRPEMETAELSSRLKHFPNRMFPSTGAAIASQPRSGSTSDRGCRPSIQRMRAEVAGRRVESIERHSKQSRRRLASQTLSGSRQSFIRVPGQTAQAMRRAARIGETAEIFVCEQRSNAVAFEDANLISEWMGDSLVNLVSGPNVFSWHRRNLQVTAANVGPLR
jgi:hypothetical protein